MAFEKFIDIQCPELASKIAAVRTLQANVVPALARAMRGFGEMIVTEAKRRCPKDPHIVGGSLQSSIYMTPANPTTPQVTIGAGRNLPYAVAVHEHPSEHSPKSWQGKGAYDIHWSIAGTGPKFIENPIQENLQDYPARAGKELEKEIAKVTGK